MRKEIWCKWGGRTRRGNREWHEESTMMNMSKSIIMKIHQHFTFYIKVFEANTEYSEL